MCWNKGGTLECIREECAVYKHTSIQGHLSTVVEVKHMGSHVF